LEQQCGAKRRDGKISEGSRNRATKNGADWVGEALRQCSRQDQGTDAVVKMDTKERMEAVAIARLLGADRTREIGTVYLWNTAELTFLWTGMRGEARYIDPPIGEEMLGHVKSATPVEVIEFLVSLPGFTAE